MPKITEYGGPQVETRVPPGARAQQQRIPTAGDFVPALQQTAQTLDQIYKRKDETAAEEALVNFERDKNKLFFDPDKGYFNSQGRDAYDGAKAASESLEELKKQYSKDLTPRAQQAFDRAAAAHITRGNADIMQHASRNLDAWEIATIKARVENTLESSQLYWNEPDRLKVQNALGRQSVIDAAKREGIDGEALNERLQTYDSSFAKGVITAATSTSSVTGKEALEKYGSMLEAQDKLSIESAIAKKEKAEATQKNAAQATLIGTNLVNTFAEAPGARNLIIEEINKIDDPELRKETQKEAMRQLDAKKKADSEERANIFEEAQSFIMDQGGTAQQMKTTNPEAWWKMTPTQRRSLENGEAIETDMQAFNNVILLPPRKLAEVDPNEYVGVWNKSEVDKLRTAVKSARNSGTDHQVGRTRAAETKETVRQLFGEPPKGGYKGDELEQVNAFHRMLTSELEFRENEKGKPLSSTEYTDLLNDMTRKVRVVKNWWPDSNLDITDIPAEDLSALSDYLHEKGYPVTADNLIKAYRDASE